MKRSKAGAMETLSVIVLAVAAIVLAAVVWIFLLGSMQKQTAALDFVFDASLTSYGSGCRLTVTVRNTGSVPIERLTVAATPALTAPAFASVSPSSPLAPGRSVSDSSTTSCGAVGTAYALEVAAQSGANQVRRVARVSVS
jgi:hypothetical protein